MLFCGGSVQGHKLGESGPKRRKYFGRKMDLRKEVAKESSYIYNFATEKDRTKTLAAWHNCQRNHFVAQTLCCMSCLVSLNVLKEFGDFGMSGAWYQAYSGSGGERRVSAHCLPCQILYKKVPIQDAKYGGNVVPGIDKIQALLRDAFAAVTVVPSIINRADQWAENNCLKMTLLKACVEACHATRENKGQSGNHSREAVLKVYAEWEKHAGDSYRRAATAVSGEMAAASVSDKMEFQMIMEVLQSYSASVSDKPRVIVSEDEMNKLFLDMMI